MPYLAKISGNEQDTICRNIYQVHLLAASTFIVECESVAEILRIYLPSACYTNFRDALFHFRRMAHASEMTEVMRQAYAIKEHLSRAKTDAMICLLGCSVSVLQVILNDEKYKLKDSDCRKLVGLQNDLNGYALNYRLGGIMLDDAPLRPSDDDFLRLMDSFLGETRNTVGAESFKAAIDKLG